MSRIKNKDLGSTENMFICGSQDAHQYNVKSIGCVFKFINSYKV